MSVRLSVNCFVIFSVLKIKVGTVNCICKSVDGTHRVQIQIHVLLEHCAVTGILKIIYVTLHSGEHASLFKVLFTEDNFTYL